MREIILIRHGLTEWNAEGRIQGQTDVALSKAGVAQVRGWILPSVCREAKWYVSPLKRARVTAELLGIEPMATVPELMEMNWGDWTGRKIAELRAELGESMRANEARGLDFRPAGGESPREVRERLERWLRTLPAEGPAIGAVTHKGVIRAAISLATGWDLKRDYGEKLKRDAMHRMRWDGEALRLVRLNEPLVASP